MKNRKLTNNDKIFIIGGRGFIGNRLASYLSKKNKKFYVGDKIDVSEKEIKLDVEDLNSLDQIAGFNCLINLAAVHHDNVLPIRRYDDVNIRGSKNICEAARKHNVNKIIFTSSVAIYGFAPAGTNESGEPNYFNHYGRTKYLAEQVYKNWQAEDPENRTLVIVRPTVIFGEGNRGNVYNLFKQISLGRFIMFGNGKNKKSMAYVENVVAFLEFSFSFKPGIHIYNYVDTPDLDMNSLISKTRKILFGKNNLGLKLPVFIGLSIGYFADLMSKLTGKSLPLSSIRVKKFISTTQFSSSASKTGFVPPFTLEEALERTIRYEFLEENSNKQIFDSE